LKDLGCKGIAPRPLRAIAGASIAPPPNLRETIEIVAGPPQFNHSTQAQPVCAKPASRQVEADNSPS